MCPRRILPVVVGSFPAVLTRFVGMPNPTVISGLIVVSLLTAITLQPSPALGNQEPSGRLFLGDSPQKIVVPEGDCRPVMLDGIFDAAEWEDAPYFKPSETVTLYFKKQKGHLFLGVRCPAIILGAAEICFSTGRGEVIQFHASAQIGERKLNTSSEGGEHPPWVWGYSDRWSANEMRWDAERAEELMAAGTHTRTEALTATTFPREGVEFQFQTSRFDADDLLARIALFTNAGTVVYPPGTELVDSAGWLTLVLDEEALQAPMR